MSVTHSGPNGQHPSAHKNGAQPDPTNGHASNIPSLGAKAPTNGGQNDAPAQWLCLSSVIELTLAMRDEDAASAVCKKYQSLPIPDPHGAAIYAACKTALDTKSDNGQPFNERVKTLLQVEAFDDETASQALEIFEKFVLPKPPIPYARRVGLREAQVLFRLENPLFPLTDAGNGERLTFHFYGEALYCVERKKWLLWNGKRWEVDTLNQVFLLAKETARKIPEEAKGLQGDRYANTLKWAIKSESRAALAAMLFLAASEEGMSISATELDRDLWRFNVQNGTLNLRTGQLEAHNRRHLQTKISPVNYNANAKCPLFLDFLDKIFNNRATLISFMQRVIGYSLTGDTREQMFLVLHGAGSNGKSVLLKILRELFADYGHTMEAKTICTKREERMPSDVAELDAKRFLACNEANDGSRLAEATVKQMTGGDEMTGERKFENQFSFTPQFQLFFATNHKPEIRGTDHAIWRRVQLVPFEVKFWDADKGQTGPADLQADHGLFEKLRDEMPGILAWAVQGCLDWQREGLGTPDEVLKATEGYRDEQDRLAVFLSNCCVIGEGYKARSADLYADYGKWAEENGEPKMSQRAFGLQLTERGYLTTTEAGTGRAIRNGITRRASEADERRCDP